MWVEPRDTKGERATVGNIWDKWRKQISCHMLCFPYTNTQYYAREPITEQQMDEWRAIADQQTMFSDFHPEQCGDRILGYYNAVCSVNKKLKEVLPKIPIGPGWDLAFEGALGAKRVLTKSYVFHAHSPVILDNIKVDKHLKTLLIRPNSKDINYVNLKNEAACSPPYWMASRASELNSKGFTLKVVDAEIETFN